MSRHEAPPMGIGRPSDSVPHARQELCYVPTTHIRRRSDMGIQANHVGSDYTDDEREFMTAMDRYKRQHHRPHPDCRDVLRVVAELGYRKVEGGTDATPNGD